MRNEIIRVPEPGQKRAILIRYGAWGDMIWASAVIDRIKKDGYHLVVNCTSRGYEVIKTDPNVDIFLIQEDGEIPNLMLDQFWSQITKGYDKVVNLSESIEGTLLKVPNWPDPVTGEDQYKFSKQQLHFMCDINYMDATMKWAGYPDDKGKHGTLYFTDKEEKWAKKFKADHPGFLLVWALSGSAAHKAYPYAESVALEFLERHPDATIVTVGDALSKLLEWDHPRTIRRCGEFGIRKSLVLTKYADCVVGPETSALNAASCFDTPKVLLLSHSSVENLSKYWENTINLFQPVECYPCHKIHYTLDCPIVPDIKAPVCMGKLPPIRVARAIEEVYKAWTYGTRKLQKNFEV